MSPKIIIIINKNQLLTHALESSRSGISSPPKNSLFCARPTIIDAKARRRRISQHLSP